MLSLDLPEQILVDSVTRLIADGRQDYVLDQLERVTPTGYEVIVVDEEPLVACYVWLFDACMPDGSKSFVVFREKSERQMKLDDIMLKQQAKRMTACP